jgi:hypothetical protein
MKIHLSVLRVMLLSDVFVNQEKILFLWSKNATKLIDNCAAITHVYRNIH